MYITEQYMFRIRRKKPLILLKTKGGKNMKKAIIRAIGNGKWFIEGINFDVAQFSKKGCILNVTELINFANSHRISITNKTSLKDADKLIY